MTRDDEPYIHFQECLTSLNRAWAILGKLEISDLDPMLWTASYHMAIIEYAKPFKDSRGAHERRHRISAPPMLPGNADLHSQLIDLRDKFLAHSDLTAKDAKVYVGMIDGQSLPLIISNTDPLLPECRAVRQHIEKLLDTLYAELTDYEHSFNSAS